MSPKAVMDRRGKFRPTGIRFYNRPARSESLYRTSYPSLLPSNKHNIKTKARMENGEMMQAEAARSTPRKTGPSAIFSTSNPKLIKTQEKENIYGTREKGGGGK